MRNLKRGWRSYWMRRRIKMQARGNRDRKRSRLSRSRLWRLLSFFFRILRRFFGWLRRVPIWSQFKIVFRSLWFRLVGAFVAVILIMLFSLLSVVNSVTARAFNQYISERNEFLRTVVMPTLAPIPVPLPSLAPTPTLPLPNMDELDTVTNEGLPGPPLPATPVPTSLPSTNITVDNNGTRIEIGPEGVIQLIEPNGEQSQSLAFLREVREGVQTAVTAAGIAAVFLGTLIFFQITRPLTQLRRATQAFAQGEWDVQVPVRSQNEVGKLAASFNHMAAELGQQERLRQQMVADVAHELRTPLTVMKSNLEAMLDGLLEPNQTELGELHEEVQRLSRLIDDLRLLSLADEGQLSLSLQPLDVRQLLDALVARLTPLAQEQSVELIHDAVASPLMVRADADKLQQAVGNLIDNALRHTQAGGRVRVTAVQEQKIAHITVVDNGPGIPVADLPYLFDRFWRGDKSRGRHGGGSGIGLSIVKQIVDLHGGKVQVASPARQGTAFTISLPLAG